MYWTLWCIIFGTACTGHFSTKLSAQRAINKSVRNFRHSVYWKFCVELPSQYELSFVILGIVRSEQLKLLAVYLLKLWCLSSSIVCTDHFTVYEKLRLQLSVQCVLNCSSFSLLPTIRTEVPSLPDLLNLWQIIKSGAKRNSRQLGEGKVYRL